MYDLLNCIVHLTSALNTNYVGDSQKGGLF